MGQKWVFRHSLEVAQEWVESGFRGPFCEEKDPRGPTFEPLPANDEKLIFDALLCQIDVFGPEGPPTHYNQSSRTLSSVWFVGTAPDGKVVPPVRVMPSGSVLAPCCQ